MDFVIVASALHRPLGFELPSIDGAAANRRVVVARHAPAQPGASCVALLPPDEQADAVSRQLRAQLVRTGGYATDVALPAIPLVVASARGTVEGHRVSLLGFAAGRPSQDERAARGALQVVLLTDARLAPSPLEKLLRELAARSFATIAGLEPRLGSASIVALANGVAGEAELAGGSSGYRSLLVGGVAVAQVLVRRLLEEAFAPARARIVQITVSGGADDAEAARGAEALAAAPTLRSALTRLAARSGDASPALSALRAAGYPDASARIVVAPRGDQAAVGADLRRGAATATRWTSVAAATAADSS